MSDLVIVFKPFLSAFLFLVFFNTGNVDQEIKNFYLESWCFRKVILLFLKAWIVVITTLFDLSVSFGCV